MISSTPPLAFLNPFSLLLETALYGSGAVLARELKVRWNAGWVSLFLLGIAYGILEEGLWVGSFFNPHWHDLGNFAWYGRIHGLNLMWAIHLSIYHAVFSICTSVFIAELLYSDRKADTWLTEKGIVRAIFTLLFGAILSYLLFNPVEIIAYPYSWIGGLIAIAGIGFAAYRLRSNRMENPLVTSPFGFRIAAWLGIFGYFIFVLAIAFRLNLPVSMLILIGFGLFLGALVASAGDQPSDLYRRQWVEAALIFWVVFSLLRVAQVQSQGIVVVGGLYVLVRMIRADKLQLKSSVASGH